MFRFCPQSQRSIASENKKPFSGYAEWFFRWRPLDETAIREPVWTAPGREFRSALRLREDGASEGPNGLHVLDY